MAGREGFVWGVGVMLFVFFVIPAVFGINAVECTDDHGGDVVAPPAMQVEVHTDRPRGHVEEIPLGFDCTAYSYRANGGD